MDKKILSVLDLIMSEYGWSIEYTMKLPITVLMDLYKTISDRKKEDDKFKTKLQVIAIGAVFSDKGLDLIDKVFGSNSESDEDTLNIDEESQKAQMRELWIKLGKDPSKFEEEYKKGEVHF